MDNKITKVFKIYESGRNLHLEVYKKCPYCNNFVTPERKGSVKIEWQNDTYVYISKFFHPCCDKNIFTTHLINIDGTELLSSYPPINMYVLPESISLISERAFNLFHQAEKSYQNNDFDIATIGYRSFIEVLSKDFLINELHEDANKVKTLNLNKTLALFNDKNLLISGDVIRYLGNDKTHYEQKYDHHSIDTLKFYLDIFIKTIDVKYRINHPPEDLQRNQ